MEVSEHYAMFELRLTQDSKIIADLNILELLHLELLRIPTVMRPSRMQTPREAVMATDHNVRSPTSKVNYF